jgi:hypothetical protein
MVIAKCEPLALQIRLNYRAMPLAGFARALVYASVCASVLGINRAFVAAALTAELALALQPTQIATHSEARDTPSDTQDGIVGILPSKFLI